MKANHMAQLTVRKVDERVVLALKQRAAAHGHAAEAEHREILRRELLEGGKPKDDFARRASKLRSRLRSGVDSTELIRADRDRNTSE